MTDRPSLIIPVEVASRELDGKLLLACLAAQRGFRAFVGCRWRLLAQMHRLPPSIYIAKDVSQRTGRIYDLLPRLGHTAMAWDEEGLVYMTPDTYRRMKVSAESLAAPKVLFAWGEDNADVWRGTQGYAGQPIIAAGNPRVDMLRPELRGFYAPLVQEIRERFGSFVLVNSNFGWVNHYKPSVTEERLRVMAERPPVPPDLVGTWSDAEMLEYRYRMFRAFLDMLPRLAASFPDKRFILRPHPSENQEVWRHAIAGCENAAVVQEGGVVPWLLAAEAVVHNGCTTGVEAFLLDRPVLAYQPMQHPVYDVPLPNSLSIRVDQLAQLVDALGAVFRGDLAGEGRDERERLAGRFISSHHGRSASERIVDAIGGMADLSGLFERRPLHDRIRARVQGTVRSARRALGLSGSHRSGHDAYVSHIFPEISPEGVQARIGRLRAASNLFGELAVTRRGVNLFELTAA